jgi:hypothetical protein
MCTAPVDHAKRVASIPARALDKHPATRPFFEAKNRGWPEGSHRNK